MIHKSAIYSDCEKYRYELRRVWNHKEKLVCWIMLNPSTADAEHNDPSVQRCMNYTKSWKYGGVIITNLFGLRSTDPKKLWSTNEPIGPGNEEFIINADKEADLTVMAWGIHGLYKNQAQHILNFLRQPHFLSLTRNCCPRHPLYLKKNLQPQKWYNNIHELGKLMEVNNETKPQ